MACSTQNADNEEAGDIYQCPRKAPQSASPLGLADIVRNGVWAAFTVI
jgi:hypothetical protein